MTSATVEDVSQPPSTIDNGVGALIARLEVEERTISQRRRSLHEQIDALYLSAPLDADQIALLDRLEDLERDVSGARRLLHARIDVLRGEIGLPRWRAARELDDAG